MLVGYLIFGGVVALAAGLVLYGSSSRRGGPDPVRPVEADVAHDVGFSAILGTGGAVMTDPDRGIVGPSDGDIEASDAAGE